MKYFDGFKNREDVAYNFKVEHDGFPTERQILFASYNLDGYEGHAFVIFKKGSKLFEVNGGHCSCDGLEGQWSPEETYWEAISLRLKDHRMYGVPGDAIETLEMLIEKNTKKEE